MLMVVPIWVVLVREAINQLDKELFKLIRAYYYVTIYFHLVDTAPHAKDIQTIPSNHSHSQTVS